MPISAGILLFRRRPSGLEVLLVHPGGPLWKNKDAGIWSIPKGLVHADEDLLVCACREFEEEIGFKPTGPFIYLTPVKLNWLPADANASKSWSVKIGVAPPLLFARTPQFGCMENAKCHHPMCSSQPRQQAPECSPTTGS